MLYLLSQCFDHFYIHKPSTSRTLNSEVYFVGISFRLREDIIAQLETVLYDWSEARMEEYLTPIPESFYLDVLYASHSIYERQLHTIVEMVRTVTDLHASGVPADHTHVKHTALYKKEQAVLRQWRHEYYIPYLGKEHSL